jgi:hypothetical protein
MSDAPKSLNSKDAGTLGSSVSDEKKGYISYTRAIFLMDRYGVQDRPPQYAIVILLVLINIGLLIYMIEQASFDAEDPLYSEPHKEWSSK